MGTRKPPSSSTVTETSMARFFAARAPEGALRLKPALRALAAASLLTAAACGGGSKAASGETTTPDKVAKDASGNVVRSSSGAAVSKEAEANWKEATAAFDAAEKAGWNPTNCESVADAFADANKKQGNKFA